MPRRPPMTAGNVVPLKTGPRAPVFTIGGHKYVLSTDGGPLGDRADDDLMEDLSSGAKFIPAPQGTNKWRYLWVYDTQKNIVAMWRVADGNEKAWGTARDFARKLPVLEKKGQLNRVSGSEFRAIEAEMTRRADAALEAMRDSLESMKDEQTRQLDKLLLRYFEKVGLPILMRKFKEVQQGVVPFGFVARPGSQIPVVHQALNFVVSQLFRQEMSQDRIEGWLKQQGFDLSRLDSQTLEWAIQDVLDVAYEYLPALD